MKVLTSEQMKRMDKRAIKEIGIIGPILMENAGLQVMKVIKDKFPAIQQEKIIFVTGKGNNGGDGLVVARHLFNMECRPLVLLLGKKEEVRGDAALNLGMAEKIGLEITEISSSRTWNNHRKKLFQSTIIVDAVFGTGLSKPAQGLYAQVIEDINRSSAYKVAVDIPSGLSSDTYQIIGPCVKADLTVALAAPKISHVFPPAEEKVGELVVADISMPSFLFDDPDLNLEMVERKELLPYFKKRKKNTHKGTYGHLLVISGSLGKTGAAVMAAKAALKMGAGLVTVGTPRSCLKLVARPVAELMTEPLDETEAKTISSKALKRVLSLLEGKDALLIGPGISPHPSTSEFVLSLLPRVRVPVVVDADGLNIVSSDLDVLQSMRKPVVLTPHPGEFARLLGISTREVLEKKLKLVPEFSKKYKIFIVFKSYRTLVSTPEGKVFINPTGNPGMATAGSGDVLSGMIASMIIQEKAIQGAVLGAVYLHGLSGDIGAEELGERFLTASDIIKYLPAALKSMEM